RRLGQVELTRHGADTLPALPHHPDRFRLELRRERSPPPLLPHDSLLSHFSCGSECLRNPGKPRHVGITVELSGETVDRRLDHAAQRQPPRQSSSTERHSSKQPSKSRLSMHAFLQASKS